LRLAEPPELYVALWSNEIFLEVKRTLEGQIGLPADKTAYLERELRRHFPEAWVTGYESLVGKMSNDPKDRHVLAAAAYARAGRIVTFNKRHFPPQTASPWGVEAAGPSAFLESLYRRAPDAVVERLRQQAANLGRTMEAQLTVLGRAVPSFVTVVRQDLGLGLRRAVFPTE
jgi:predicted nucleic acid-binding protein